MSQRPLGEKMPVVREFLRSIGAEFGFPEIGAQIRAGMEGTPVFWARENGHEVGTRAPQGRGVTAREMVLETAAQARARLKAAT